MRIARVDLVSLRLLCRARAALACTAAVVAAAAGALLACSRPASPPPRPSDAPAASAAMPPRDDPRVRVLGEKPLCEASGARFVLCATAGGRCLIVADNENDDALFRFAVDGEALVGQQAIRMRPEVKDAEGIERIGDRVLVIGSHSRRSWDAAAGPCSFDARRLSVALLAWHGDALEGTAVVTEPEPWRRLVTAAGCRSDLLVPVDAGPRELTRRFCDRLAAVDAAATSSRDACGQALNVEGVVALRDASGAERVWLGLRAPRLDDHAVLLRLSSLDALRFDAIALLDLGGAGVRDLASASGALWVLAGPSADEMQPGSLWRVAESEVRDGAVVRPRRVTAVDPLPPYSEALAIDASGRGAFVLVDGDESAGDGAAGNGCPTPARYLHLTLP